MAFRQYSCIRPAMPCSAISSSKSPRGTVSQVSAGPTWHKDHREATSPCIGICPSRDRHPAPAQTTCWPSRRAIAPPARSILDGRVSRPYAPPADRPTKYLAAREACSPASGRPGARQYPAFANTERARRRERLPGPRGTRPAEPAIFVQGERRRAALKDPRAGSTTHNRTSRGCRD